MSTNTDTCDNCKGTGIEPDAGTDRNPDPPCHRCRGEGVNQDAVALELPKCIAAAIAELDEKRANALRLVGLARLVEECVVGFEDLSPNPVPFTSDITIYVYVKDSLSRVVDLIRVLRKRGYKMSGHYDLPENRVRSYSLSAEAVGDAPDLCIYASIYGADNARCKYVKVGEKTVPVMQLQCDDAGNGVAQ